MAKTRKFQRIDEWKTEIAARYGTQPRFVVRDATFAHRGHLQRGREILGYTVSPRGASYTVFAEQTAVQRSKHE